MLIQRLGLLGDGSEFAFTGLLRDTNGPVAGGLIEVSDRVIDVAAIRGFDATPKFYETFHVMALRSTWLELSSGRIEPT